MKKSMTLALSVLLLACTSQGQATAALSDEQRRQQQAFLREAVASTPYSAVVERLDIEILPMEDDPTMEWHIVSAEVLEVVRGEPTPGIRYAMAVEKGEDAVLSGEPILLTLCVTEEGADIGADYYWPGVGALFSANPENLAIARASASAADAGQTGFSHCE